MSSATITIDGVPQTIADIEPYRAELAQVRKALSTIYENFDPQDPLRLLDKEAEIVELANRSEELRKIVELHEAAVAARDNILAVWTLVQRFQGELP